MEERRRRLGLLVATAIAVSMLPLIPGGTAHAGGVGSGATYVALGDSYAAGEGLGPFEAGTHTPASGSPNTDPAKNTCHRSQQDGYGSLRQTTPIVLPS